MPRRKTPTDGAIAGSAVDLDDGEAVVVETHNTRTIRRQKTPVPAAEDIITVDLDDEDEDEPDELPSYSPTSLAALLNSDDGSENYEEQYCTINVRRNPDGMNDNFVSPNAAIAHLPRLVNIPLTADKEDIQDKIRSEYGGGHYFFQIRTGSGLGPSWTASLADLPAVRRAAAAAAEPAADRAPAEPPPAAVPVDPFERMIDSMTKQKQLKDLLFGDDRERLEKELAELKAEAERLRTERNAAPAEPPNERLLILEKALGVSSPTIQARMLESVFPADEGGHWLPDTIKTIFEHKEEIGGLVQMVLGGLLGGAAPQPAAPQQPDISAFLRQPAPAAATPSRFGRRPEVKPELAPADVPSVDVEMPAAGPAAVETPAADPDADAIDAEEVTDETPSTTGTDADASAAKPKRKGAAKK